VCLSYVVRSRVLAIARAAAATVDVTASCCATILVAARGPDPTDPFESRMFSIPFNNPLQRSPRLYFTIEVIPYKLYRWIARFSCKTALYGRWFSVHLSILFRCCTTSAYGAFGQTYAIIVQEISSRRREYRILASISFATARSNSNGSPGTSGMSLMPPSNSFVTLSNIVDQTESGISFALRVVIDIRTSHHSIG
jgi:hypothetical protein